jgi:hypothetical protein
MLVAVVLVVMDHIRQQVLVEQAAEALVLMVLAQQLLQLLAQLILAEVAVESAGIRAHQAQVAPALLSSSTP